MILVTIIRIGAAVAAFPIAVIFRIFTLSERGISSRCLTLLVHAFYFFSFQISV
jgi:hypothetical protein